MLAGIVETMGRIAVPVVIPHSLLVAGRSAANWRRESPMAVPCNAMQCNAMPCNASAKHCGCA